MQATQFAGVKFCIRILFGSCLILFLFLLPHACRKKDHSETIEVPGGFEAGVLVSGLLGPTAMAFAPDGRLFICEQQGVVRVFKNGALLAAPYLAISVQSGREWGLLGLAFDPDFQANGRVYIYYTDPAAVRNRVVRYNAGADPDVADPASAQLILDIGPADSGYHNGGALHFGLDGMLYISVGEAGVSGNSQTLENLQGKLLRIDAAAYPAIIPADNPFVAAPPAREEIWSYGLRNPFTFAVDPATGTIYVNDVGKSDWEEVNEAQRGGNHGWPFCEGNCNGAGLVNPVYAYHHGDGCAVTGGVFYRGLDFSAEFDGDYFFADLCEGHIRRRRQTDGGVNIFANNAGRVVDLDVGPEGYLYALVFNLGMVRFIRQVGM